MSWEEIKTSFYTVMRTLIPMAIVFFGFYEGFVIYNTGYLNPKKQLNYLHERAEENSRICWEMNQKIQKTTERYLKSVKEYDQLYSRLYNGIIDKADVGKDGLSFVEQVGAWKRMGYSGPFFESKGSEQFPRPTLENLETAVNTYDNR